MAKFIINGQKKLSGDVEISGAKNAALKMIAGLLLTREKSVLKNVPDIADIHTMIEIVKSLGAKVNFEKNVLMIDPSEVNSRKPNFDLVRAMRASIVLAGPLLAKFGKAEIAKPGGCVIGARPVYIHWNAFKKFGAEIKETTESTILSIKKLFGKTIVLDEMSVTATENMLMLSVLAPGATEIRLAAAEPEIVNLAEMFNEMGAKISGAGTHTIKIIGVKKLHGLKNYQVIPDRIEAGTFAILGAINNGGITIKNIIPEHLDVFFNKLSAAGVNYKIKNQMGKFADIEFLSNKKLHPIKIDTRTYPGFPTDLQAPMSVLLTQCPKTSKIFETLYDNRLKYLTQLKKMKAKINILDSHTAEISGPAKLFGTKITSFDLRAGATLILAGLIAKGQTEIDNIQTIDRGYENIENKLTKLGADIIRTN